MFLIRHSDSAKPKLITIVSIFLCRGYAGSFGVMSRLCRA